MLSLYSTTDGRGWASVDGYKARGRSLKELSLIAKEALFYYWTLYYFQVWLERGWVQRSLSPRLFHAPVSSRWQWQELIRRWDSERELLRSAPGSQPEFAKITQNNTITPFKVIQGYRC